MTAKYYTAMTDISATRKPQQYLELVAVGPVNRAYLYVQRVFCDSCPVEAIYCRYGYDATADFILPRNLRLENNPKLF